MVGPVVVSSAARKTESAADGVAGLVATVACMAVSPAEDRAGRGAAAARVGQGMGSSAPLRTESAAEGVADLAATAACAATFFFSLATASLVSFSFSANTFSWPTVNCGVGEWAGVGGTLLTLLLSLFSLE